VEEGDGEVAGANSIVMESTQPAEIFRYSPITVTTFAVVICAATLVFLWAIVISVMQFLRAASVQNFALVTLCAFFVITWAWAGVIWLRNRPNLKVSSEGVWVIRFGSKPFLVKWQSINAIKEIVARVPQTGRVSRNYHVASNDGDFRFDTYYTEFEKLLRAFNEAIDSFGIAVLRVSMGETTREKYLEIVPRGRQGFTN
jgi:hypothetical protein